MKKGETSVRNKVERKTREKNRRIEMKRLCFKLVSLIPPQHFKPAKELLSQQDQLDQAAAYIKILRKRIEELRRRKTQALMSSNATNNGNKNAANMGESTLPILKIKEVGTDLEVVLISGLNKKFKLHQLISIIEQEGAQVINVSICYIGNKIFHNLHAQVKISRIGVDTSRICERIHEFIS